MKVTAKIAVLITGMFMTLTAMGGHGMGGGVFGKTKLLLQSFTHQVAILTPDDVTNIPETDLTPRIKAPEDEYPELLAEACEVAGTESDPFILPVDLSDGSVRNFAITCVGGEEGEPRFLLVTEVKAENEKAAE